MNITERFIYPTLDRVTNADGSRFYTCPDTGLPLMSVTTIIDGTSDKTKLLEWRARVGDVEADRQSNMGKNLGSLVHENIENYIMDIARPGGSAPLRKLATSMSQRVIDECLPHVTEVWGIEKALYLPGLYAGTADLLGCYKGRPAVVDHKNAKKMRKRNEIGHYADQMAAYAIAHNAKYGTDIDQGVIFMVDRSLNVQTYVFEGAEFQAAKASFLTRVEKYLSSQ